MEKLEKFAELANETRNGAFTLTKTKKKVWTIYFPALWNSETKTGIRFMSGKLSATIEKATTWLLENRKPIDKQITRYEI